MRQSELRCSEITRNVFRNFYWAQIKVTLSLLWPVGLSLTLTTSSSMSFMALGGSMAPSMVVLLNTPLILLPILLIPNDSPRFDVFLEWTEKPSRTQSRSRNFLLYESILTSLLVTALKRSLLRLLWLLLLVLRSAVITLKQEWRRIFIHPGRKIIWQNISLCAMWQMKRKRREFFKATPFHNASAVQHTDSKKVRLSPLHAFFIHRPQQDAARWKVISNF